MLKMFVVGRFTADPEVRTPQNGGEPFTVFSVAVNTGKNQDGSQKTTYIRVKAFRKQGEMIAQSCRKGHQIALELANLEVGAYVNQSTGQAQGTLDAILSAFDFCEKRENAAPQQQQYAPPQQQPQYAQYAPPQQQQYAPPQPQHAPQPPQYATPW